MSDIMNEYAEALERIKALEKQLAEARAELTSCDKYAKEQYAAYDKSLAESRAMARKLAEALESIEEYWNGGENSAVYAAEEMRFRAQEALSLYSKEK